VSAIQGYDKSGLPNGGSAPVKIGVVYNASPAVVDDADVVELQGTASGALKVALSAGTDNIGDVDIASMPASDVATDQMGVSHMTNVIMNDRTELTPAFFYEAVTASDTDEEIIALQASKKLRILSLFVQAGGTATDVTFESSTTTTKFKVTAGINGGCVLPFNPIGWFESASGESITVTTGAGSTVQIAGAYVAV
jgi:hypothetical protein